MKIIYFNLNMCLCVGLSVLYFLNGKLLLLLLLLLLLYSFLQINNDVVEVGILSNLAAGCCLYTVISILLQKG